MGARFGRGRGLGGLDSPTKRPHKARRASLQLGNLQLGLGSLITSREVCGSVTQIPSAAALELIMKQTMCAGIDTNFTPSLTLDNGRKEASLNISAHYDHDLD